VKTFCWKNVGFYRGRGAGAVYLSNQGREGTSSQHQGSSYNLTHIYMFTHMRRFLDENVPFSHMNAYIFRSFCPPPRPYTPTHITLHTYIYVRWKCFLIVCPPSPLPTFSLPIPSHSHSYVCRSIFSTLWCVTYFLHFDVLHIFSSKWAVASKGFRLLIPGSLHIHISMSVSSIFISVSIFISMYRYIYVCI
jgi:hypothetical protein